MQMRQNDDQKRILAGKMKILIAEDVEDLRKLYAIALRGYKIDFAEDGIEALAYIHRNQYDVIITDGEMPRMNGYDLIRAHRLKDKLTPMILFTSGKGNHIKEFCKINDAIYVNKDLNRIIDLATIIDKIIFNANS